MTTDRRPRSSDEAAIEACDRHAGYWSQVIETAAGAGDEHMLHVYRQLREQARSLCRVYHEGGEGP